MKSLFTLEAEIEGKEVKIQVKEDLDIFTIAHSIAKEYELGEEAQEEIMVVILETLTSLMDSTDVELKASICKLLNNTVRKEAPEPQAQQYQKRQATLSEQNTAASRGRGRQINLYERALKAKRQKSRMAEEVKEAKAEKEVKECTFQPQINTYPFLQRNNTHEILYKNAKMVKEKKQIIRKNKQQQEVEGFSFKPELNQNSLKLLKNKSHNSFKRPQQFEEHPYQPTISKGSQKIAERFPDFQKRLERYMSIKKETEIEKDKEKEKEKENSFLSRPSKGEKDKYREIFDDEGRDQERRLRLYGMLQPQCKHEQEPSQDTNISSISMNTRSEQLFLKRKIRAFELIFDNVEENGIVNSQTIQCHNLSEDISIILQPLLSEISELQVSLNKSQFLNSLERLYSSLGTIQKQMLINRQTKKKWQEGHEQYRNKYKFRPVISQNSKDLAMRKEMRPRQPLKQRRRFQNLEHQQRIIQRYISTRFGSQEQLSEDSQEEDSSSQRKSQRESRFTIQEQEDEEDQCQIQEGQSDVQLL